MVPNPYMIYGAIALSVIGFGAGWQVRSWRCEAAMTDVLKDAAKAEDAADVAVVDVATEYEDTRANISAAAANERTVVMEIYRDIEVPADCAIDPAARGMLEAARDRANAAASGELGAELPAASAASRRVG